MEWKTNIQLMFKKRRKDLRKLEPKLDGQNLKKNRKKRKRKKKKSLLNKKKLNYNNSKLVKI